jgi:para-nitrobenzyl esterase
MAEAKDLFHKAAIESGVGPDPNPPEHATEIARQVLARAGLAPGDARKLLEVPASLLLKAQMGDADPALGPGTLPPPGQKRAGPPPLPFGPVIDGVRLTEIPFSRGAPEISRDKPLIVGGCKEETIFFNRLDPTVFNLDAAGLKAKLEPKLGSATGRWIELFHRTRPEASPTDLYIAISTAMPWRATAIRAGGAKAAQGGAPVFMYIFAFESELRIAGTAHRVGAPHASDIAVTFDNAPPADAAPIANPGFFDDQSEARRQTARNMSGMWANFARTGQPSAPGQPAWRPYTLDRRATMLIDAQCRLVDDPEGEERRFWEGQDIWARL